ncbi:hypothetical protein ElyMa_003036000 [Elysia marginata]|uniref:Uncharacterized protein n=1 Tax=Elysia marginata TaxID=1093978 RepID=A0AAV4IJB4_9GAST|nr:hypothetical protein ElyMa_003036000 [Elysia marginata]
MFCLSNSRAIPRGRVRRNRLRRQRANKTILIQDLEERGAIEVRVTQSMGKPAGLHRGHPVATKFRRKSRFHLTDTLSISSTVSWLSAPNTVPGYSVSSHSDDKNSINGFKLNHDSLTRNINAVGASNNVSSFPGVVLCSSSASAPCCVDTGSAGVTDEDIEDSYHYDNDGNLVTTSGARYKYNFARTKGNSTRPISDSISSSSCCNSGSNYFSSELDDMPAITHFVLEGSRLIKPVRLTKFVFMLVLNATTTTFITVHAH